MKQTSSNQWCNGLYLRAGTYKKNWVLREDKPIEFISQSIFKIKGLPLTLPRELLSEPPEKTTKGLTKRLDLMIDPDTYEFLVNKSREENKSLAQVVRNTIFVAMVEAQVDPNERKG